VGRHMIRLFGVGHEHRQLLGDLKSLFPAARAIYDSVDSPYLHYLREPSPSGIWAVMRAVELWKTRKWERLS
jgi:hypothetical protein